MFIIRIPYRVSMRCTITGDVQQMANIEISEHEEFIGAAGAMTYTSGNVTMDTKVEGGLLKGLRKNASLSVRFRSSGGIGSIGLAGPVPGKIIKIDTGCGSWIFQRSAYLGSEGTVDIGTAYQKKLPSSLFGDEGLVLSEASGPGSLILSSCGDFYSLDLRPGDTYKVSAAKALAWQSSIKFGLSSVGGMKAAMFGSEGLFIMTFTGPGEVLIQSSSIGDLAASVFSVRQK
jgi:uncharacterized protein (TIGR00266 family)